MINYGHFRKFIKSASLLNFKTYSRSHLGIVYNYRRNASRVSGNCKRSILERNIPIGIAVHREN